MVWFVFSSAKAGGLVERLRREVQEGLVLGRGADETVEGGEGEVVRLGVAVARVEERCPLLMACYREAQRFTVHQVSTRVAMKDTVLSGKEGKEYLLKEGAVVQLVIGVGHAMREYWGEDVGEFRPERFLGLNEGRKGEGADGPGSARAMRAAFQPFGGGLHLCPGRQFAFAELMAVMGTLLLGFEVEPLEGADWNLPGFATRSLVDAVTKPANNGEGFGVKVTRRPGWEGVRWSYEL
ncbi:cytochrome P450 [Parachaetomium inaequale]|uniref:Cytochrome P450 n=1 Tax=Parachaetomium inaequale TaxID=2588326 RepID=A0AAN6SNZ0_9PEZI|nr:cytochrome P450 [Parachaetomium inaequale]